MIESLTEHYKVVNKLTLLHSQPGCTLTTGVYQIRITLNMFDMFYITIIIIIITFSIQSYISTREQH